MIFKLDIRTVIIIVLSVILFFSFDGCSRIGDLLESETVIEETTTTKTDTTKVNRSFIDIEPMPDYFKPTPVKVEFKDNKVKEVPDTTPIDSTEEREVREVNKYTTVSELPNGTITGSFLIDGKLLSTEFKLDTQDQIITNTTEKITTIVKSSLLGEVQTTFGLDGRIKDVAAGPTYYHKGNWSLGTMLQYDVDPLIELPADKRLGVIIKLGFKF